MSYNIELVPARLMPFDWNNGTVAAPSTVAPIMNSIAYGFPNDPVGQTMNAVEQATAQAIASATGLNFGYPIQQVSNYLRNGIAPTGRSIYPPSHPLYPLTLTNGLVFPYNPVISEGLSVAYDKLELTHTNESIHAYRNTENVRITLSDCIWTAETFDQAIYLLGVIHFFRSYTLMDYGSTYGRQGKTASGRPPSPMWFYAYGSYLYEQVPVLLEKVDWSFPNDVDYVGVPNPGSPAYVNQTLQYATSQSFSSFLSQTGGYTWVPMKFTVGSIGLVVQHSVAYWKKTFNLDDFKAGRLVGRS